MTDDVVLPNPVPDDLEGIVTVQLPKVREWGVSVLRTSIVPQIAAAIITLLAAASIDIDAATVSTVVFAVVNGLWYSLFRGIEVFAKSARFRTIAGWLLGLPRAPLARVTPHHDVVETTSRDAVFVAGTASRPHDPTPPTITKAPPESPQIPDL